MKRDLSLKKYLWDYVVLDIETTGFDAKKDDIIELSAIKVVNGEIEDEFSKLIKPYGFVSNRIIELTGITREMLADATRLETTILEFNNFCKGFVVIGHNVTFDLNFINAKLYDCHKITFDNDYIDTLKLAKKHLSQLPSKKLGVIAEYFQLDTSGMHRGLKDCSVTIVCYQKFCEMANVPKPPPVPKFKTLSLFDI